MFCDYNDIIHCSSLVSPPENHFLVSELSINRGVSSVGSLETNRNAEIYKVQLAMRGGRCRRNGDLLTRVLASTRSIVTTGVKNIIHEYVLNPLLVGSNPLGRYPGS